MIEKGSAIGGVTAGAALSLLTGTPLAAGSGVLVSEALKRLGLEAQRRFGEPRRQERVGTTLAVAAAEIDARLKAGEVPRTDDFFSEIPGSGPSPGEEILEGVLQDAADSFEQRKAPYLGRLFASLVFAPTVNAAFAARLVRIADQLTYRQLVCVAILAEGTQSDLIVGLAQRSPDATYVFGFEIGFELDQLGTTGLVGIGHPGGEIVPPGQATGTIGGGPPKAFRNISAGDAGVTTCGRLLYELMKLDRIPAEDRQQVLDLLMKIEPGSVDA
jgi:hypothetical protein